MFAQGSYIVYRNLGVCRVEKIARPEGIAVDRNVEYYTLRPLRGDGVIYVPVDSKGRMRLVMSRPEADALLHSLPSLKAEVCRSRDRRVLQECYNASLQSQSGEELLRLIKSITIKEKMLADKGKKLGMIDTNSRRQAQELIYGELSCVLGIPYENVEGVVRSAAGAASDRPGQEKQGA